MSNFSSEEAGFMVFAFRKAAFAKLVALQSKRRNLGKVCHKYLSTAECVWYQAALDTHGLPPRRDQHRDVTDQVSQYFQRTDRSSQGPKPLPNTYYRKLNIDAVDARHLAVPPNFASRPPRRTTGGDRASALRSPPRANDLQQRPNDGSRISDPRSRPDRDSQDIRGPRIPPRRDASDRQLQGGASSAQHKRNRATPGGRARASASGGSREPKKRLGAPQSTSQRISGSKEVRDEPSEEEFAYLNSRDHISFYSDRIFEGGGTKHLRPVDTTYIPADISAESLQGMGPALACGEWGMSETVGERLIEVNKAHDEYNERIQELAQKFGQGKFCHFRSKRERTDTMNTIARDVAGEGDNAPLDEGEEKEKMERMDTRMAEERAKLATRLLKGDYQVGPLGKGPTAEVLERYTLKNESYFPKDRLALAAKIATLLPLDKPATRGNRAKA
ncbi:MAG: hypothetical protein Q9182_003210 [Xanthomendoza sp. 2 TL-2023]